MSLPRVLTGFKFSMLFRNFKRNVPPVSTVSHFCVPIDYKRASFFMRWGQNVHSGLKQEHFAPDCKQQQQQQQSLLYSYFPKNVTKQKEIKNKIRVLWQPSQIDNLGLISSEMEQYAVNLVIWDTCCVFLNETICSKIGSLGLLHGYV